MLIDRVSMLTGKAHTLDINVTPEQMQRWQSGEKIQHVMPHLSKEDREFIMTGSTKEEWDSAFKEKYEEDAEPDMEDEEAGMYEAQAAKQIEQPERPKPAELTEEKRSMLKQMWALDNNIDPIENTWTDKGYQYYRDHLKEIAAYYQQNAAYWKYMLEEEEYWDSDEAAVAPEEPYNTEGREQ